MTALAMIPAGVVAARQPEPTPDYMIAADLRDLWPASQMLIGTDLRLLAFAARASGTAAFAAFEATPYDRGAITGMIIGADLRAPLAQAIPYERPAVLSIKIGADTRAPSYRAWPYERPPVLALTIGADTRATTYRATPV